MSNLPSTSRPWFHHRLALAICIAERGTTELYMGKIARNNPGDIMDRAGKLCEYSDLLSGFTVLLNMIGYWFSGKSEIYHVSMSIREISKIYTGDDHADDWATIVSGFMGVNPSTTLSEIEQYDRDAQAM